MADIVADKIGPKITEGPSRYSHAVARTHDKWGIVDLDMQLWTVDGSNGAAYTADYGTDEQIQFPILLFDDSSDDGAYIRFRMPPDYNESIGKAYLHVDFFTPGDHDATHLVYFKGEALLVPHTTSTVASDDHADNVVIDTAMTSIGSVAAYLDDTVSETKSFQLEITSGVTPHKFEQVHVLLANINATSTTVGSTYVSGAFIRYSK